MRQQPPGWHHPGPGRLERWGERWRWFGLLLDLHHRFNELQGGVMAASLTLTLFLSLFPLLLVASAVLGWISSASADLAGDLVARFGVTGDAAKVIRDGVHSAERSRRATTVVGFGTLLWASLGIVSALQQSINRAWQAKDNGWRDKLRAVAWLAAAGIAFLATLAATGLLVTVLPAWAAPLSALATTVVNVLLFWWTFWFLGSTKVGWRPVLPGAVLAGVGAQLLTILGAWWLPQTVARSSALYGSIGVVFAVIAWLFLFGRLVVYASILNVVLYEREAGTVTVEIEAPRIPGEVPLEATRAGIVIDEPTG